MAWTAKFGTKQEWKRKLKEGGGYRFEYLGLPTEHLWLTRGGQGIATCAPFKADFSVRMSCCGIPIDAHPHGWRVSAIPHLWGRQGLQWCVPQPCRGYPAWAGDGFDTVIARGRVLPSGRRGRGDQNGRIRELPTVVWGS